METKEFKGVDKSEPKLGDFLTCISAPSKVVIFGGEAGFCGGCSAFTILYDLPTYINGRAAYTMPGVKFPFIISDIQQKQKKH